MQRYEYFVIYENACSKKQAWVVAHACIFMDIRNGLFHYTTQNVVLHAIFQNEELCVLYHFACVSCINGHVLNACINALSAVIYDVDRYII